MQLQKVEKTATSSGPKNPNEANRAFSPPKKNYKEPANN